MRNARCIKFHIDDGTIDPNTPAGMASLCAYIDGHAPVGRAPPPLKVSADSEAGPIAFEMLAAAAGQMLLHGGILDDALADVHKVSVRVPAWAPTYQSEDAAGVGEEDIKYPPRPDVMTIYTGLEDWDFQDAARGLGDGFYLIDDWYEAIDQASRLWLMAWQEARTMRRLRDDHVAIREATERAASCKPVAPSRWPIWTVNEDLRKMKIPRRSPAQIARLRAKGDRSVSRGPSV